MKFLDSEALGKQIFLASRRFFGRLARDRPVVLVFEDMQWMDESSTKLLEHLLPLTRQVPLLIIGTSRPNRDRPSVILKEMATKDDRGAYTEIILQPLSQNDSLLLLHNLLEIENLSPHLRQMIVAKADGNPFFLEEVLRTLIDKQIVRQDPVSGQWRATAQIELVSIPDTIQGVIMARVDQLNDAAKYILRVASIIGRNFLYRILLSVAEEDHALDEHIAELLVLDLIREHKRIPELEYIFKHALTQEATYESILLKQRRVLHARVGQAIENLFALRLDEFYGVLAYHYAQAETWEKAQEYLLKAGDQAERIAADMKALIHINEAWLLTERAFGSQSDPRGGPCCCADGPGFSQR
jgi:predicted ATPase